MQLLPLLLLPLLPLALLLVWSRVLPPLREPELFLALDPEETEALRSLPGVAEAGESLQGSHGRQGLLPSIHSSQTMDSKVDRPAATQLVQCWHMPREASASMDTAIPR